jgi:hypothetical protein
MAHSEPLTHDSDRVRSIDDSARTLAVETVRAIGGLLVAFAVAWGLSDLLDLGTDLAGFVASAAIFLGVSLCTLTVTSGLPIRRALTAQRLAIATQKEELEAVAAGLRFGSDVHAALEMAEYEPDVHLVVARALDHVSDGPGELLLADSSRSHIHRAASALAAGPPGCGVGTPWACPAVRRGQTLEFSDSHALATCPHLQARADDVSALCVPVTVLGTPMGVVHLTDRPGRTFDDVQRKRAEDLATQTGARIGLLRAMATSTLAASTDALTGQLNRRSLEEALRRFDSEGIPYAVAFADLDHFKILNDTHGHAAGDRALGHFATIAASSVRTGDLVCRFGGDRGGADRAPAPVPARRLDRRRRGATVHGERRPVGLAACRQCRRGHRQRRRRPAQRQAAGTRSADHRLGTRGGGRGAGHRRVQLMARPDQPASAAARMAGRSSLVIPSMAVIARWARAGSGSPSTVPRPSGTTCHDRP